MEKKLGNTPATDAAFDRMREALTEEGAERYPNGTVFLPVDRPHFDQGLAYNLREGRPVAMVFADGSETLLDARRPRRTILSTLIHLVGPIPGALRGRKPRGKRRREPERRRETEVFTARLEVRPSENREFVG